ncbi:MAG: flavin reductase family protein [Marinilabiliaceae bacterium]
MANVSFKPGNMLYPLPVVMVSCGDTPENYNILTVAWAGTICSTPPMVSISVRKERHSHGIISRTGEFVINLTTEDLVRATDWCGVKSGRDVNKWQEMNLTPSESYTVKAPGIAESPVAIECKVKQVIELGSHDMFIAEVTGVRADDKYIDPVTGAFELEKANPICYSHGKYYAVGRLLGKFGFSVKKKSEKKK